MPTRPNQSLVSVALLLVVTLGAGACAGRQHAAPPAVQDAEQSASDVNAELQTDRLQFDNQATVYVDVYLVGGQLQWRLGRVQPGDRAMLRVPESALPWTLGFVQLAVIPGSQMAAEAWRDPRAVLAIAQPMSEVLSHRWTFRQPGGAVLQLQSTRLTRP
jgi:hypothetical protein